MQCCITAHLDRTYGKRCGVWLADTIALRFKRLIRSAYVEDVRWPSDWYRVVRGGKKALPCSGLQAGEMRALFQILPLVLPGILGERGESTGRWTASAAQADYLTSFFVSVQRHYYELRRYNRPAGGHTDRTIQTLEHGACRIQDMLQTHFAEDQKSEFKLPKTHAGYGPHVGNLIRLFGSPRRFMTEFGEGSVKTGNAAYQGSAVDSYTIAFGLRNVTRPEIALREATRVLRRGGRLLVLEFSQVEVEPLRSLYDTYSFSAIPAIGKLVVRRPATLRGVVSCSRLRTALLYAPARRATPPPTSTWWRASDSFRPKRSWQI